MPFEDVLVSYERGFVGDYSRDVGLSSAIPSNRSRSGERPPKKLHFNEKSNDAAAIPSTNVACDPIPVVRSPNRTPASALFPV